jgi:hypothetical protein
MGRSITGNPKSSIRNASDQFDLLDLDIDETCNLLRTATATSRPELSTLVTPKIPIICTNLERQGKHNGH